MFNTNLKQPGSAASRFVVAVLRVVLALGGVLVPTANEEGNAERSNAAGLSELLHDCCNA